MTSNDWFFGLDAGGTKTRLFARSGIGQCFQLFGGPANVFRQGRKRVASNLSNLIKDALLNLPQGALRAVHIGVAGVSVPSATTYLSTRISSLVNLNYSFPISISNDGVTAIEGAFSGESGLLFIAGTGSGVIAKTGPNISDILHVGGWGYVIGDEGSGYSLGKRAITAIAQALDGGPSTSMTHFAESKLSIFDRPSLLAAISHPDWKFQDLAPEILEFATGGDEVAASIVREETMLLAGQSKWILSRFPDLPPRFTIIGGLSNNQYYVNSLSEAMNTIWSAGVFMAPLATPAEGAAHLAIRQFTDSAAAQSEIQRL
ncbi:MAG: hypothetical protein OXE92_10115 [Bacteroidetes bacterium]|nr:hypothetical protein [Bacteroidota bacterium]MCY4206063.1 hypothetical protein [Bacteroidota bacterium]